MTRSIFSCPKFVIGSKIIKDSSKYIGNLGDSIFLILDPFIYHISKKKILEYFSHCNIKVISERFNGECSLNEISRLSQIGSINECNLIIGIGGGKTLDTAKVVADKLNAKVAIIPTIASTDSPLKNRATLYTDDSKFLEYRKLKNNPDLVLVDSSIIAKAPLRFFVCGIGDALSTYIESRSFLISNTQSKNNTEISNFSLSLAELCHKTLMKNGLKAKNAVEKGLVTPAVDAVIESIIYLSAVSSLNSGLAASHAIATAFSFINETSDFFHGELVGFSNIVHLVLENTSYSEIEKFIIFCLHLELPITLEELGFEEANMDKLSHVAKAACYEVDFMKNMPMDITPKMVHSAILSTDSLVKKIKNSQTFKY